VRGYVDGWAIDVEKGFGLVERAILRVHGWAVPAGLEPE
jgi:hypothetical protein